MPRRTSLERRLFAWLLVLALLPPLVVMGVAVGVGAGSLEWIGTLGPWDEVAQSGRDLFQAAEPAAAHDPRLASALERHRSQLSESLVQARRWSFLGHRLASAMPLAAALFALVMALLVFWLSRHLARQLARPISELVVWADRMARGEPLPPEVSREKGEVREVGALRGALRTASVQIIEGRARALEAERMRAWGEMARRVAHEMKNPLTPLRLAAHRLGRLAADPAVAEVVTVINEETERLEDLSRQFSALGRPSSGPPSEVDLAELLEALLASDVPPAVQRSLDSPPSLPLIQGHYDALVRSFRNLLRNAVEAVASKGDQGAITLHIAARNGGVAVTVADNGPGIPPDRAERIFEPDFTMKAGGTGLGLAVVRQVVGAHGGRVQAQNRPEGGAEFEVWLPLRLPRPEQSARPPENMPTAS